MKKLILVLVGILIALGHLQAQDQKQEKKPVPEPQSFVTSHQGSFGGKTIKYRAIARETYLKNDSGDPVASIWSVSYLVEGVSDYSRRPVMFIFNGGPGSASVWLHMGLFGPQLVQVNSDAREDDGAAPYPLVPNQYGLLDLTDLVFVDPVGTGYSRVVGEGKVEDYWGLNEDASSVAQFMRQWITENGRWYSPKYIAGESPWSIDVHYDLALPCATQNEIRKQGAELLVKNGVLGCLEGANLPTSLEAQQVFRNAKVLYVPGKASNAGGVGVSGLEMSQNAQRLTWRREEVDQKLQDMMQDIYNQMDSGGSSLEEGANRAGFLKVAKAMKELGWVY